MYEFVYVIEKTEYRIYLQNNHLNNQRFTFKNYRKLGQERIKVQGIIELAIEQIKNIPQIHLVDKFGNTDLMFSFIDSYDKHKFDFYDFITATYCKNNSCLLITDDIDYNYSNFDLNIYTLNDNYN